MLPYYVESNKDAVGLYRLKDGRYQMIEQGDVGPFMYGYGYLLVERELAEYLESINLEKATFKSAIIFDHKSGKEYKDHVEVVISQHFSTDQVNDINLEGDKFLVMNNEYIYASPSLKKKLEHSNFKYLEFSEGLSKFAG